MTLFFLIFFFKYSGDHTIVAVKVIAEAATVERLETDWDKVRAWLEGQEENKEGLAEWEMVGDPYEQLRELSKSWPRVVRICGKRKRWWKREWKPLRKKAMKCKEARKKFHEEIRKAKRETWVQWVEEGKQVWDIARVARNPFNLKTRCTKDEEGQVHSDDSAIATAFVKHNLITEEREEEAELEEGEEETGYLVKRRAPSSTAMKRVLRALSKTKNKSAAGPDGISWWLLKMIKGTPLGRAVLEDVALWATPKERVKVPEAAREMTIVMIPKPGKDHSKVKGWRPIVLANTVGKLGEKLIAGDL